MISTSDFLTTIFKDILDLPVVSDRYVVKYDISRNIFSYYIKTNTRLGKTASKALTNIILSEIATDKEKKTNILIFMNELLSEKEKNILKSSDNIIETVVSKYSRNSKDKHNKLEIVDTDELLSRGWTLESYITECFKFWDSSLETGKMPDEHKGHVYQWVGLSKQQPDNRRMLLNEHGQLIGFWDFLALFDDSFEKAKKGELLDGDLSVSMLPIMLPGTYNIYVDSMMIADKYRKTLALKRLLFSMIETFEQYAQKGVFINEICAWAYSEGGISISKSLGLSYIKKHKEHGEVYCGKTVDLLNKPICNEFKTLKTLYIQHFKVQSST